MRKKKVKVSVNKMNTFQCTVNSVLTRLKKRNGISNFSIEGNNPLIKIKVDLFQGKRRRITFNVATSKKITFNEVRKVISKKIH